jgi:hypothetical protein
MSDYQDTHHHGHDLSNRFDQDYDTSKYLIVPDHHEVTVLDHSHTYSFDTSHDFFHYQDPLRHVYKFQFEPMQIDLGNMHFVHPHHVSGYVRKDGTAVEDYYRDGDGDTSIDRPLEAGGGYYQGNPDGNPGNNLNK